MYFFYWFVNLVILFDFLFCGGRYISSSGNEEKETILDGKMIHFYTSFGLFFLKFIKLWLMVQMAQTQLTRVWGEQGVWNSRLPYLLLLSAPFVGIPTSLFYFHFYCKMLCNIAIFFFISPASCYLGSWTASLPLSFHPLYPSPLFSWAPAPLLPSSNNKYIFAALSHNYGDSQWTLKNSKINYKQLKMDQNPSVGMTWSWSRWSEHAVCSIVCLDDWRQQKRLQPLT